jgi:hypothetical protein
MSRQPPQAALNVVLPGLVAGGLCGAAVAFSLVPPAIGVVSAVACGLYVGYGVWRIRREGR